VFKFKKIIRVNDVAQQNTSYKDYKDTTNLFINANNNNNQLGSTFGYNRKQSNENEYDVLNSISDRVDRVDRVKFTPQVTSYGMEDYSYKNY